MGNQKKLVIVAPPCFYENDTHIFNLVEDIEDRGLGEPIAEAGRVYMDDHYILFAREFWRESSHYLFDYLKGVAETNNDADRRLRQILHCSATEYAKHVNKKYESYLNKMKELEGWQNVTLEDLTLDSRLIKQKVRLL